MAEKIVTPIGELMYVQVRGEGKLDYNGTKREYTAGIKLEKDDYKKMKKIVSEFFVENKSAKYKSNEFANKVFRKQEDGTYLMQFKTNANFEKDDGSIVRSHIPIKNSKGIEKELPEDTGIGNGSIGRISGTMDVYSKGAGKNMESGVSLFLKGIQLTKFVPYKADDGLEEVEGDFDEFDSDFDQNDKPAKKKKKKKK